MFVYLSAPLSAAILELINTTLCLPTAGLFLARTLPQFGALPTGLVPRSFACPPPLQYFLLRFIAPWDSTILEEMTKTPGLLHLGTCPQNAPMQGAVRIFPSEL
jgi:hypothetical protein